jgi:hypothetical protein
MINIELVIPQKFYSPYGYVEVDKNDYQNREKETIQFVNKQFKFQGTIKVS